MTDPDTLFFVCIMGCLISLFVGLCCGNLMEELHWKKEIIKRGFAQYHPQTGKWEWKE